MRAFQHILIIAFLSSTVFGQVYPQEKLDSIFNSKVPYDSSKAVLDIDIGLIQIIQLTSSIGDPGLTSDELSMIENRFGFKYHSESFDIPQEFLTAKQNEYNKIVYRYLDSINNCDTQKEIEIEALRLVIDNYLNITKSDKEIEKKLKKELRKEKSDIRDRILIADKHYRDKDFQKALDQYQMIENMQITNQTKAYIYNSMYHCLLNLLRYDDALEMQNNDTEYWIHNFKKL
jgi:hypothetical protein